MKVDKIKEKEIKVKGLIDDLRTILNSKSIDYSKNTNDWSYLTSLTHTETKLKELIDLLV